jgi:hypothetical protein
VGPFAYRRIEIAGPGKTLPERATRKQLKQQLKEMDEYIPQQRRRVDAWTLKELEPVAYA